jgi:nitric oxide reductase activation protein
LLALTRGVLETFPPILEAARALLEQDQNAGNPPDWARLGRALQRVQRDEPLRLTSAPPPLAPRSERQEEPYEEAWRRVASQVEELGATLERVLRPRQRLGWRNGFATGQRVDLRSAMRAEADPRYLTRVWSRKTVPSRPRSAWSLLVDLSGSMRHDGRIKATLSAVALFAETLVRLRIPFRIDGFQDELIPFVDFDQPFDASSRRRLGEMTLEVQGRRPGGHNTPAFNDDGPCLLAAAGHLLARPEQDRLLMVLCDGHPEGRRSGMKDLEQAIQKLQPRLTLVGLGLGPDTSHVTQLYPVARANLAVEHLATEVGALLQDQLLALR